MSMFQRLGNQAQQQSQDPRSAAMDLMKRQGIDVPQGMENDPNALIQYVMQSGRYPQSRLTMAQNIVQKMFRR